MPWHGELLGLGAAEEGLAPNYFCLGFGAEGRKQEQSPGNALGPCEGLPPGPAP